MSQTAGPVVVVDVPLPPLENGDHLTRAQFERRWDAMPGLKHAELVEGVVYLRDVGRFSLHARPRATMTLPVVNYVASTSGLTASTGPSVRMDTWNMPQPDLCLFVLPDHGGQARVDVDGFVAGGPDLLVEITSTTASLDLHAKAEVYRRNGVREYVVWRTFDAAFDCLLLADGRYEKQPIDADGVYRSRIFPGLWVDVANLLLDELAAVKRTSDRGLATPAHAAFVAKLAAAAGA